MSEENKEEVETTEEQAQELEALKPKRPAHLAPQGIRTFTVCRRSDETGVSGDGIVIEGIELSTGQAVVHWLWPRPRGSIAVFDSFSDFVKVHIQPHPKNGTIITFEDGEQQHYGMPDPAEQRDKEE